jgi:hypothetical protein
MDWVSVGLVLSIVGSFLLANSILFRHPRQMVQDHFGKRSHALRPIREYIFHRVQVNLGFLFLLIGFGLQLFGRLVEAPEGTRSFPTIWVGVAVLSAVLLLVAGWWWSHRLFRGYVREYLLANPPDFERNARMARDIGELFGVSTTGLDTVQSYAARLRQHIGLDTVPRSAPGSALDDVEEDDDGEESSEESGEPDTVTLLRDAR